jgi:ketopantoate reductase
MSELRENVLLFGLGGIGGVYASILSLSKAVNVHVVARSNYESVKEKGFKFVSEKFGNHEIQFEGGESSSAWSKFLGTTFRNPTLGSGLGSPSRG